MITYHEAEELAARAHAGQRDKGGYPYIMHCRHVADAFAPAEQDLRIVAVLHDVLEDAPTNWNLVLRYHCSDVQYDALRAITRNIEGKGEAYHDYIKRVALNPIARRVKIEDLKHNLDDTRIPEGSRNSARHQKYAKALLYLLDVERGSDFILHRREAA